ncbi:MAG: hypothetical protein ACLPWF_16590 [Bryobacteraceae bacterium]
MTDRDLSSFGMYTHQRQGLVADHKAVVNVALDRMSSVFETTFEEVR